MLRNVLPPTYLLVAIVLILLVHFIFPIAPVVAMPWNLVGLLPLALGVALNLLADRALKEHQTTVKPFEESNILITNGVYRLSRHPMYLGFVLIVIGISLLLGSISPYIVVVMLAIVMEVLFIRAEETMLADRFGAKWRQYASHVRKWI